MGRLMEDEDDGLRRRLQAMLVATNKLAVCMIVVFTLHIAGKGRQRRNGFSNSVTRACPPTLHPPPPHPLPAHQYGASNYPPTHLPNFSTAAYTRETAETATARHTLKNARGHTRDSRISNLNPHHSPSKTHRQYNSPTL